MKNIKFFILLYLILLPYASVSYGVTDSWCSNGRYDKNIKPFPKPSFNKCPENARRTMTLKEVESYYLDGVGQEYICNLSKNPLFFSGLHKRKDLKNLNKIFLYKQDTLNSSCKEFYRIKLAKKKAIEDKQKEIAAKKTTEVEARKNALAEKKAEEEAKIRALAEKLAKEEIAKRVLLKQKKEEAKQKALAQKKAKEDAPRKKAIAKKKAEEQAKQKTIAAKKAKEDKARNKALAKEKAEELAKQKAIAAKKAEEEKLQKKVLNEKIQKIKDEAKFIVATLKEYVTTDTNKLDILEVSELLENYNSEMQKGWSDNTVEKYEELYDYVQKDEGFIEFSADKKSKQLAAYNEEIRQLREYLTTSQSDLKAFITKNLGSNNAKKALKLAKETKQILKDFEVSQAMTLRNNIVTWKAMNGVAENQKYAFKILNKKSSIKDKSRALQTTQKKRLETKSLNKLSSKINSQTNYFPEFLNKRYWTDASGIKKSGLQCDQIVDKSEFSYFTEFKINEIRTFWRDKSRKNENDVLGLPTHKVRYKQIKNNEFIENLSSARYRTKNDGECTYNYKYKYSPKKQILINTGEAFYDCSKTGIKPMDKNIYKKRILYWCSGEPKKAIIVKWAKYSYYSYSKKKGYNSTLNRMEPSINCHYDNGEIITIGMYSWQRSGCIKRIRIK